MSSWNLFIVVVVIAAVDIGAVVRPLHLHWCRKAEAVLSWCRLVTQRARLGHFPCTFRGKRECQVSRFACVILSFGPLLSRFVSFPALGLGDQKRSSVEEDLLELQLLLSFCLDLIFCACCRNVQLQMIPVIPGASAEDAWRKALSA